MELLHQNLSNLRGSRWFGFVSRFDHPPSRHATWLDWMGESAGWRAHCGRILDLDLDPIPLIINPSRFMKLVFRLIV